MTTHNITLDRDFTHTTATHSVSIKWTCLGQVTAPPIIFIHGTPWSSFEWYELGKALSPWYRVFFYDHPGFGSSPSPERKASSVEACKQSQEEQETEEAIDLDGALVLRAEASAALIRSWSFSDECRPHVIAHDNGGLVSLRLLLQHDIAFQSLCLIDVVALQASGLPFFKLVSENSRVFNAIPSHLIEGFVRSYVRTAVYKTLPAEVEDALCEQWLDSGSQGPARFFQEMVQAHHRNVDDVRASYDTVGLRVPTKIIWGADDKWIPPETARKLKDALGADECVVVSEAGHLIQFDQPARLALEVGFWLNKHTDNTR